MDWEPDPQTSHRERGHELTLLFAPFEMYFHFENGYDPRDLVVQIRQEQKVAKDIGLTQRSHCHDSVNSKGLFIVRTRLPPRVYSLSLKSSKYKDVYRPSGVTV